MLLAFWFCCSGFVFLKNSSNNCMCTHMWHSWGPFRVLTFPVCVMGMLFSTTGRWLFHNTSSFREAAVTLQSELACNMRTMSIRKLGDTVTSHEAGTSPALSGELTIESLASRASGSPDFLSNLSLPFVYFALALCLPLAGVEVANYMHSLVWT